MNWPQFAIINDVDKPCWRHVCQHVGHGCYRYLHPELRYWAVMTPSSPTDMADFGWDYEVALGQVLFHNKKGSTATYADGKLRFWQDTETEHGFKLWETEWRKQQ